MANSSGGLLIEIQGTAHHYNISSVILHPFGNGYLLFLNSKEMEIFVLNSN